MEPYELSALMRFQTYNNRDIWESARLIAYVVAQTQSKKKLKLKDIVKYAWDDEIAEAHPVCNIDIERLREKARKIATK